MSIEVRDITKSFDGREVLHNVSLSVPTGELVALLGPSGCGKTTLLRIIAGLEVPDGGVVLFDETDATSCRANERKVGFVFQHYALFRHMSVFENVAFGLRVRPKRFRPSPAEIRKKVMDLLTLVQVDFLAGYFPSQLSGGQRQRVALARALAVEPRVLLLDEPFGALDAKVRQELRRWLRRLHDDIHITSVFVTHDQEEALEVADRIVIMNDGRIEQVGNADDVYDNPATPFVYNFLGNVNLFHGRVDGSQAYIGDRPIEIPGADRHKEGCAIIYVRPHQIEIGREPPGTGCFRARLEHVNRAGAVVKLELRSNEGNLIQAEMPRERYRELAIEKGSEVFVNLREMKIFGEDTPE